jgi:hypothetical protein
VIHEGKNGAGIVIAVLALIIVLPSLLGAGLNIVGDSAEQMTKPVPGNAKRTYGDQPTTPTTAAPQMTEKELEARMQAKSLGDGLAAARAATPAPQVDPRGGLPSLDGGGTGGIVGELPAVGGIVRALTQGGGLKALNP